MGLHCPKSLKVLFTQVFEDALGSFGEQWAQRDVRPVVCKIHMQSTLVEGQPDKVLITTAP